MATENEKVESVLREIDEAHETWKRSEVANLPTQYLKEWHDRIESAHRREVEELRDVGKQMLRRWCNLACTCEHCEFNAEPCSRWRKILEGENDEK